MKQLKQLNCAMVLCGLQVLIASHLAAMHGGGSGGDGKGPAIALLGSGGGGAPSSYGAVAHGSALGGAAAGTGGESKTPAKTNEDIFCDAVKAGSLDEVRGLFVSMIYGLSSASFEIARWHALEYALSAEEVGRRNNYLEIFRALSHEAKRKSYSYVILKRLQNKKLASCCGSEPEMLGSFLLYAVDHDNVPVVQFLLGRGVLYDYIQGKNIGGTSQHNALAFCRSTGMAKLLISSGIDVNHEAHNGLRAVDVVESDEVRRIIVGADGYLQRDCSCSVGCLACFPGLSLLVDRLTRPGACLYTGEPRSRG